MATPAIVPFDICCGSAGGAAVVVAASVDEDVLLARAEVNSVVNDEVLVVVCVVDGGVGLVLVDTVCVVSKSDNREDLTSLGKAASRTDSAFVVIGCSGRFVTAAEAPAPIADARAAIPALLTMFSTEALVGRTSVLVMAAGPRSLLDPRSMLDICGPLL